MTIPSLFGYFSCEEQLTNALNFYVQVSQFASPEVCVCVLQPFFRSGPTWRFLEHAFDQFFRGFFLDLDVTPERERSSLIPIHAGNLLQCFTVAIPLLPRQHLQLFRELRAAKFPTESFSELILTRFLWPAARNYLRASTRGDCLKLFERILGVISGQTASLKTFYGALFRAESLNEGTKIFKAFGHSYLLYFLSVNDVLVLSRICDQQGALPRGISLADFGDRDARAGSNCFWCQVFPRVLPRQPKGISPLIFTEELEQVGEDDDRSKLLRGMNGLIRLAKTFEQFLDHRWKLQRLRQWLDVLQTQITQLMVVHFDDIKGDSQIQFPREIQQMIDISSLDREIVSRYIKQIGELGDEWEQVVATYRDGKEMRRLLAGRYAAYDWVWRGIRVIMCNRDGPLQKIFPPLIRSFVQFQAIAMELDLGITLLRNIVGQLPADVILAPFLILNATVAQNLGFMKQTQRLAWLALQSCVLDMMKDHTELLSRVVAITEAIGKDHRK
jgi:hypothetical protein